MAEQPTTEEVKEKLVESVFNRIKELSGDGFVVPDGYNVRNELIQAFYILTQPRPGRYGDGEDADSKKPLMQVCTRESIVQSLFVMVSDGLSAIRKQGYFIPYGKECTWKPSYFGNEAIAKRIADVVDVDAFTVHQDDEFGFAVERGKITDIVHKAKLENMDKPIIAAYAYVTFASGKQDIDLMTIAQIKKSWDMAQAKGEKNKLQTQFSVEAAKRTISNRALKPIVNTAVQIVSKIVDPEDPESEAEFVDHEVMSNRPALEAKTIQLPPATEKATVPIESAKAEKVAAKKQTEPVAVQQSEPEQKQTQAPVTDFP